MNNIEILPNEALSAAQELRDAKLVEFEKRRIARSLAIPIDDNEVRAELRKREHPVCLFGEDDHDRRERLRELIASEVLSGKISKEDAIKMDGQTGGKGGGNVEDDRKCKEEVTHQQDFYTEGNASLRVLRHSIAMTSLPRSRARLAKERRLTGASEGAVEIRRRARVAEEVVVRAVRNSYTVASHVGDERPLSTISCLTLEDGDSTVVATGSWGGRVKLWRGDASGELTQTIDAHSGRVSCARLPREESNMLLTCGADGIACIFRCDDNSERYFALRAKLDAHNGARVSDVQMHPFHRSFTATGGFDGTVALFDGDVNVLSQPTGHDKVYRLAFHPDGSLLGTCGLDGGLRVWDLRSGRAIMTMTKGHADDVLGVEFCSDGRVLASCGADNVFRIWDLRTVRCIKTVAAHRSLVSGMRFGGGVDQGDVLYTCSFDRTVKCWGSKRNWGLLAVHTGYEDKITALDCSPDARVVVTACYDKTWKLIGNDC